MKTLACGAMLRIFFCLQILAINFMALMEDRSFTHEITATAGPFGYLVLICMTSLAFLGLIDAIINDIFPEKYVLHYGLHTRHIVFMAIPICYAIQLWFAIEIKVYCAIPYYLLNIIFMVISAFLDVQYRYKAACPISTKAKVSHA